MSEWTSSPVAPKVAADMPTRIPVTNFPTASPASTTLPSLLPGISDGPTALPPGTPGGKLIANAGPDAPGTVAAPVTLTAAGSSPIVGTVKYLWEMASAPATSTAVINNPTTAGPTFTPNVAGAYVARLTVYDNVNRAVDTVTITVP